MCLFVCVRVCEVRMSPVNRLLLLPLSTSSFQFWYEKLAFLFAISSIFIYAQRLVKNFLGHANQMINYVRRLHYKKNFLQRLFDDIFGKIQSLLPFINIPFQLKKKTN